MLRIRSNLNTQLAIDLTSFLKHNIHIFAWTHADIVGISPDIICYVLNIDNEFKQVCQKRRAMDPKHYAALKTEMDKLLSIRFIREAHYPSWVANPVLVKKPNSKW